MRKMKRIKRWTGVLLAGFIGAGVCFSGTAVTGVVQEVTAYADTVPEVEVSTDKTTAKPGDKVKFVMDVKKNSDIVNRFSDEYGGSVFLIIRNVQTGSTEEVELSKKTDDTYEGEIEVTSDWYDDWYNGWYNGKYTVAYIRGINSTVFNKNINLTINSAEDAPAVKKVAFDKNKVDSGEEVEVSIAPSDIEDIDLKDVRDCNLSVSVGKGLYYWSITLVPDNDGKFKGVFEVNDRWLTGDYKIKEITVGHTLMKMPNPESTVFSVTESGEDQKSPVVRAINLDKKAAVPGGVIKITADAEDSSGTGEISLSIHHESEWYGYTQEVMLKPDEKGVPTGYLFINDNWKNGKYTVKVRRVKDKLGNYVSDDYNDYNDDGSYGYGYVQTQTFTVSGSKEESPREDNNSKGHIEKREVMIGEEISIVLESDEPTSQASFRFSNNAGGYYYVDIYRRSDGKFEGKVQIKNDYQEGIIFNEGDEWIGEGMQLPSGREIIIPYYENGQPLSFKIIGTKKVVKNISLDKTLLVLDKGKTGKLTATVTPADADDKTVTWSSSNTNVATVDASGNVKAINHGTAKITAKTSNGKTAECEVQVNADSFTGVKKDGGQLKRFKSGAVDTAYTGVDKYTEDGKWYYFEKGIHNPGFTGIAKSSKGNWIFVKDGVYDAAFAGIAKSTKGNWLYAKNGRYDTSYTGVAKSTKGNWLYVTGGRWDTKFTGAAKATDGRWLYVKDGRHDSTFTGAAKSTKGNWIYVNKGVYTTGYSGVTKATDGKWLYMKNGRHEPGFTGVAKSDKGNWIYVKNGVYDTSFTGVAKSTKGNWIYVKNGRYDASFTGIAQSTKGNKLYIVKGRWQNTYTGKYQNYNIKNGYVI